LRLTPGTRYGPYCGSGVGRLAILVLRCCRQLKQARVCDPHLCSWTSRGSPVGPSWFAGQFADSASRNDNHHRSSIRSGCIESNESASSSASFDRSPSNRPSDQSDRISEWHHSAGSPAGTDRPKRLLARSAQNHSRCAGKLLGSLRGLRVSSVLQWPIGWDRIRKQWILFLHSVDGFPQSVGELLEWSMFPQHWRRKLHRVTLY